MFAQRGKLGCANQHGRGSPPCRTTTASPVSCTLLTSSSDRSDSSVVETGAFSLPMLENEQQVRTTSSRSEGHVAPGSVARPLPIHGPNPVDSRRPAKRRIRTHFAFSFTALARKIACRKAFVPTPSARFESLPLRKSRRKPPPGAAQVPGGLARSGRDENLLGPAVDQDAQQAAWRRVRPHGRPPSVVRLALRSRRRQRFAGAEERSREAASTARNPALSANCFVNVLATSNRGALGGAHRLPKVEQVDGFGQRTRRQVKVPERHGEARAGVSRAQR